MKIRMVQQMSGLRADRQPWPGPGAEFEVGDAEGAALAAQGIAVPVAAEERKAEARPAAPDRARGRGAEGACYRPARTRQARQGLIAWYTPAARASWGTHGRYRDARAPANRPGCPGPL